MSCSKDVPSKKQLVVPSLAEEKEWESNLGCDMEEDQEESLPVESQLVVRSVANGHSPHDAPFIKELHALRVHPEHYVCIGQLVQIFLRPRGHSFSQAKLNELRGRLAKTDSTHLLSYLTQMTSVLPSQQPSSTPFPQTVQLPRSSSSATSSSAPY